jgi:uncharacterized protein with gpF-like domain
MKRFDNEADGLVQELFDIGGQASHTPHQKIELSDIDIHDWDWWDKYGDEVADELAKAFEDALISFGLTPDEMPFAKERAIIYARSRGARLLRLDGDLNMMTWTRERVRSLVAQNIEAGEGLGTLARALRDDVAFSPQRATTVARTETATALGQGQKQAAQIQGLDEKQWVTQGDDRVGTSVQKWA